MKSGTIINWKHVARDVAVNWLLTGLGGSIVGFTIATSFGRKELVPPGVVFSNAIFLIIGFCISGCLVKTDRFKHLWYVTLFTWIAGILNIFLGYATVFNWLFSIVMIAILMWVGGGLSLLFVKDPVVQSDEPLTHH